MDDLENIGRHAIKLLQAIKECHQIFCLNLAYYEHEKIDIHTFDWKVWHNNSQTHLWNTNYIPIKLMIRSPKFSISDIIWNDN